MSLEKFLKECEQAQVITDSPKTDECFEKLLKIVRAQRKALREIEDLGARQELYQAQVMATDCLKSCDELAAE